LREFQPLYRHHAFCHNPSLDADEDDIAIDRGGTFTDCIATDVPGREDIVLKLLSVDPSNYNDAPTVGFP
jgi:hypothetical protein